MVGVEERVAEVGAMAPGEEIGTGITPAVAGTTMVGNVDRTGVITVEEEMTEEEEAVAGEVATLTSGIETVAEEWAARTGTTSDTRR